MENMECPKCWDGHVMHKDDRIYREETREVEGRKGLVFGIWLERQRCQQCGYTVCFTTEGEVI